VRSVIKIWQFDHSRAFNFPICITVTAAEFDTNPYGRNNIVLFSYYIIL